MKELGSTDLKNYNYIKTDLNIKIVFKSVIF